MHGERHVLGLPECLTGLSNCFFTSMTHRKPFVITDILGVKEIGDIVGTLGFADVHLSSSYV